MNSLYHGDNGCQEFWENDDYLLMRVHGEQWWTAHQKHHKGRKTGYAHLFSCRTAGEGAKRLGLRLDTAQKWRRWGRGFRLMTCK